MTDRIDTPADLVATLATISESLSATAMPTLDNIEAQLLPLLDDAEARNDQQAITLIRGTYARAQELINVAQASRENAATAVDLAQNFRNQRDGIAKELDELRSDVDDMNLDNSSVAAVYNAGCEEAFEDFEGFHTRCPGCDVCESGHLPQINHDAVNNLLYALMGLWNISPKRARQLTRFVNTFSELCDKDDQENGVPHLIIPDDFVPDPDGWNDDEDLEDGDDDE